MIRRTKHYGNSWEIWRQVFIQFLNHCLLLFLLWFLLFKLILRIALRRCSDWSVATSAATPTWAPAPTRISAPASATASTATAWPWSPFWIRTVLRWSWADLRVFTRRWTTPKSENSCNQGDSSQASTTHIEYANQRFDIWHTVVLEILFNETKTIQ